eukprot:186136-Chlamydomonas_euryale.AAC.10
MVKGLGQNRIWVVTDRCTAGVGLSCGVGVDARRRAMCGASVWHVLACVGMCLACVVGCQRSGLGICWYSSGARAMVAEAMATMVARPPPRSPATTVVGRRPGPQHE